jgi:LysR family glycine cleavage system transcriptional activator
VRQLQDSEVGLVESGQGIALANEVLVREELHTGKLVRVVDAQVKLESYRVLTPSAELSADVAWFIDWLKSELEQDFPEAVICA